MYKKFLQEIKFRMARHIAEERNARNLTQEKFSELIGVQREPVAKIETGRRNLTLDILIKSCIALDIPIENIVNIEFLKITLEEADWEQKP